MGTRTLQSHQRRFRPKQRTITMGSSDNFCLRWNDFESNISTSFRELRDDSEFFDVTLCCDNGTDIVPAHKVILAACSPLFRKILSRQKNQQNPFLYLKGIRLKELQAVLNFMYHGEVNVAQDSLNNFLAVAEELAVKGLTTDSKPSGSGQQASGASMVEEMGDDSYAGDDGADDFGDGEDFEGFAQYGDGQEFDDSLAGASGSGAGADGKGFLPLLLTPTKNPEIVFTKNSDIKSGPNVE